MSRYDVTAEHAVQRHRLRTGDLLFWHNDTRVHHVGLYYGAGEAIHAPRTGKTVSRLPVDEAMPPEDYYAATRLLDPL
jgi:cell wall-associated NlpC family hydrolase